VSSAFPDEKQKGLLSFDEDRNHAIFGRSYKSYSRPGHLFSVDEPFLSFIPPGRRLHRAGGRKLRKNLVDRACPFEFPL